MPQGLKSRRLHSWLVVLCVAVVGLLLPTQAGAITSAECDAQVNDTPCKLLPCVQKNDLWGIMQNFQAIADANPGPDGHPSRNSGEPGYKASAKGTPSFSRSRCSSRGPSRSGARSCAASVRPPHYVASEMEAAGYDVRLQPYTFEYYAFSERRDPAGGWDHLAADADVELD